MYAGFVGPTCGQSSSTNFNGQQDQEEQDLDKNNETSRFYSLRTKSTAQTGLLLPKVVDIRYTTSVECHHKRKQPIYSVKFTWSLSKSTKNQQ